MFSFYACNKAISVFLLQNEVWGYDFFCEVEDWIIKMSLRCGSGKVLGILFLHFINFFVFFDR